MIAPLAGRSDVCSRLQTAIEEWRSGKGNILFVAGEPGMGKSAVLGWMEQFKNEATPILRVDCRAPIGSFNVGAIAPLQPFGMAIEQLYLQTEDAAKKRLALNVGMSLLSAIPLVGDFIYAVKAVSQDVNEYKRETAAMQQKKRAAVDDCVHSLKSIASRSPFILLVDDGHWADAQSIEVVKRLMVEASHTSLLIVWTFTPSVMQRTNINLASLVKSTAGLEHTITLKPLERNAIPGVAATIVPNAQLSESAIDRLHERSAGIPGIVAEYITYLKHAGSVKPDGTIADTALDDLAIRASDHPATDIVLKDINEDDALILSMAAAEGREFTAFMMAALMNTDVVSVIRMLRRIANATGLIKSIGVRTRYGVKTTIYEFTQSFGYTYFLHRPEYEERKAIHQRITDILSREHSALQSDDMRHQLAVLIAAHSNEAEDQVTAMRMLEESARAADEAGASDIADLIRSEYYPTISLPFIPEEDAEAPRHEGASTFDTAIPVARIASYIVEGDSAKALQMAAKYITSASVHALHASKDYPMLLCLAARACIELGQLDEAQSYIQQAETLSVSDPELHCTVLNLHSTLLLRRNEHDAARSLLRQAAVLSSQLTLSSRVLTLGNIINAMRVANDKDVTKMERTLRRLVASLGLASIRADLKL